MKKKYLGELLKDRMFGSNTLIIARTGSGKTDWVFNGLITKNKRSLYLCDNENLRMSIEKMEGTYSKNKAPIGFDNYIEVMCYKAFGKRVRYSNEFINQFDTIICDEIHNLVSYQEINDDADLSHAIKELFKKYDSTQIFYLTATPYYLTLLKKKCKNIDQYVDTIDFTKCKELKCYTELVKDTFSSYKQIPKIMKRFENAFTYGNKKALIYTRNIETMKKISNDLVQADEVFQPIAIWSNNNELNPMNKEQIKVRDYLLETGELMAPYNVLIINRATETGVNITDKDMVYCLINTTNVTEQEQVRGRLRHDIIELRLKIDKDNVYKNIDDIDEFLDRPLTKRDKDSLAEKLGLYDKNGRLMKWAKIKESLLRSGFRLIYDDKPKKLNGKVVKVSEISK